MLLIGKGPSHRALCSSLNIPRVRINNANSLVHRVLVRTLRNGLRRFTTQSYNLRPGEPIIYWGVSHLGNLDNQRHPSLNRRIVFDKLHQLGLFENYHVSHPTIFHDGFTDTPDGRWLGRRRHHVAGRDITGPWTTEQMRDRLRRRLSDYGVQLINKTHEWRVHVFNGEILRIARKVWPDERGPVPDTHIWNAERGWHFRYDCDLRDSTRQDLGELAKRAVVSLGMDFGAVDIIGVRENNRRRYYALEVNSAPGVADNVHTLAAYTAAIRRWADAPQI